MSDADSSSGRTPGLEPGDAGSSPASADFDLALAQLRNRFADIPTEVNVCDEEMERYFDALTSLVAAHRRAVEAARAETWRVITEIIWQKCNGTALTTAYAADIIGEFKRRAGDSRT